MQMPGCLNNSCNLAKYSLPCLQCAGSIGILLRDIAILPFPESPYERHRLMRVYHIIFKNLHLPAFVFPYGYTSFYHCLCIVLQLPNFSNIKNVIPVYPFSGKFKYQYESPCPCLATAILYQLLANVFRLNIAIPLPETKQ